MLTGLYPHNHGVWSHEAPWGFSALRDEDTLPVWMQRAGYYNTYMGKYLNGYGSTPEPGKKTGTSTQYCPPGWDLWRGSVDGGMDPDDPQDGGTYRYFDTTLNDNCNGFLPLGPTYQTTAYGKLASEQLVADKDLGKPWFNYVSFTAPHHGAPAESDDPDYLVTPARPKRIWGAFDKYIKKAPGADWLDPDRSDKPTRITKSPPNAEVKAEMLNVTRQRAEAVYLVDQQVKKILGTLKSTGQLDNTLVIFTSDNGYFLGEQGERQGKILPYEPSLRVPVLMRGPGIPRARSAPTRGSRSTTRRRWPTSPTPGPTRGWTAVRCSTWPGSGTSPRTTCGAGPSSPRPSRPTPRRSGCSAGPRRRAHRADDAGQDHGHPDRPLPLHRVAGRAGRQEPRCDRRAVRRAEGPRAVRQPRRRQGVRRHGRRAARRTGQGPALPGRDLPRAAAARPALKGRLTPCPPDSTAAWKHALASSAERHRRPGRGSVGGADNAETQRRTCPGRTPTRPETAPDSPGDPTRIASVHATTRPRGARPGLRGAHRLMAHVAINENDDQTTGLADSRH